MTLKLQEISHVPCRGIRKNRSLTVSGVGSFGINIHIGNGFIKVKYGNLIVFFYTVAIVSELSSHMHRLRVAFARLSQA